MSLGAEAESDDIFLFFPESNDQISCRISEFYAECDREAVTVGGVVPKLRC